MNRAIGILAGARPIKDGEAITHDDSKIDAIDRQCNRAGKTLSTEQRAFLGGRDDAFLNATLEMLMAHVSGLVS